MQLTSKLFANISITSVNTKTIMQICHKKVAILKFTIEALNVNCKPGTHLFLIQ